MTDLPSKPRLLMFLQGMLMLTALGSFLGLFSYGVRSLQEIRLGSISINTLILGFSLITLGLSAPAVHFINKRRPIGRSLGVATYSFGALRALITLVWFALPSNPIGQFFSKPVFIGIMAAWIVVYLVAAFAFALSPKIKNYFYPEHVPSDVPPPPPNFTE